MKIYTASELQQADRHTIEKGVPSLSLMEKAAERFSRVLDILTDYDRIHVFCGTGNNGGDGMAIARMMDSEGGYKVKAYLVHYSKHFSEDLMINYQRLDHSDVEVFQIYAEEDFPVISKNDIVVDALFGIGLNRSIKGLAEKLIQYINESGAPVFSVDIPSGLYADVPTPKTDTVIHSHLTISFTAPKLSFLMPDNKEYLKDFIIVPIGLNPEFLHSLPEKYVYTELMDIAPLLKHRDRFDHKGKYGHALVIAGSYGKSGAAVLATRGALRIGAGLVTAYIPKSAYSILQTSVPEAMVEVDDREKITYFNFQVTPDVIGIGPGLGTDRETREGFRRFLQSNKAPLILDADALNILSMEREFLQFLPEESILTPHEGELKRLIGSWENDWEKLEKAQDFSNKYKCVLVIKGRYTIVIYQDKYYFNSTGNPGMATGGSGDVLAGVLTGLVAQGYNALDAARLGVFIHGLAGDIIYYEQGKHSMTAGDIAEVLPKALDRVYKGNMDNIPSSYGAVLEILMEDDYYWDDDFDPLDEDDEDFLS